MTRAAPQDAAPTLGGVIANAPADVLARRLVGLRILLKAGLPAEGPGREVRYLAGVGATLALEAALRTMAGAIEPTDRDAIMFDLGHAVATWEAAEAGTGGVVSGRLKMKGNRAGANAANAARNAKREVEAVALRAEVAKLPVTLSHDQKLRRASDTLQLHRDITTLRKMCPNQKKDRVNAQSVSV